jgi:hypothetical protein
MPGKGIRGVSGKAASKLKGSKGKGKGPKRPKMSKPLGRR